MWVQLKDSLELTIVLKKSYPIEWKSLYSSGGDWIIFTNPDFNESYMVNDITISLLKLYFSW